MTAQDRRWIARSMAATGVATVVSSALGLLLLVVVARWLGPDDNAAFLSIWGLVFGVAAIVGAGDGEIARLAARAAAAGSRAPRSVVSVALLAGLLGVLATVVAVLTPWGRGLTSGSPGLLAVILLAPLAVAGQSVVRSSLLGSGDVTSYAVVVVAEAVVRLAALGLAVWLVAASLPWAVTAVVTGCFGWLAMAGRAARVVDWARGPLDLARSGRAFVALAGANGLSALVLTAYPTLVAVVLGGSQGLAVAFAAITVARLPLVLLGPAQALVVPVATRMLARGERDRLGRLRARIAGWSVAGALGLGGLGYAVGSPAMVVAFGPGYAADPMLPALSLAATCLIGGSLLLCGLLVAHERYLSVTAIWAVSAAAALLGLVAPIGTAQTRTMAGFALAGVVALAAAMVGSGRADRGEA